MENKGKLILSSLTYQNSNHEEIKCRLKVGNSSYCSIQTLLSSRFISMKLEIRTYKKIILSVVI